MLAATATAALSCKHGWAWVWLMRQAGLGLGERLRSKLLLGLLLRLRAGLRPRAALGWSCLLLDGCLTPGLMLLLRLRPLLPLAPAAAAVTATAGTFCRPRTASAERLPWLSSAWLVSYFAFLGLLLLRLPPLLLLVPLLLCLTLLEAGARGAALESGATCLRLLLLCLPFTCSADPGPGGLTVAGLVVSTASALRLTLPGVLQPTDPAAKAIS
jgi:hypothetical protein